MTESPLVKLFADRKIRAKGDALAPLLCAKDVAESINDLHYRRLMKALSSPKDYVTRVIPGNKRSVRAIFFTERGVYKYLTQSRLPGAVDFQEFVYDLLSAERQRVVDAQQLQAKIDLDAQRLRIEVLQQETVALKTEICEFKVKTGELESKNAELKAKAEVLVTKNDSLKGSVQYYKQSSRTSDWLLTKKAPEAEEAFRRPDAYWTDLAKYYILRANFESEKKLVKADPADIDPRLQRIAQECFAEPTMWYDGYAIFLKKAQEIYEQTKLGIKPEKIYTIKDVDPAVYAANLKLVQADSARQRAARGLPPISDESYLYGP